MKSVMAFVIATILLPAYLSAQTTVPQTGTIKGTVTDRKTGEPLIGAKVMIEGIERDATTDIYGKYSIDSIPGGMYTLKTEYIGYKQMVKKSVKVRHGKITRTRLALKEETRYLEIIIPCERKYCPNVVNDDAEFEVELFRENMTIPEIFEEWQRIAISTDQFMLRIECDQRHHVYRSNEDLHYKLSKIDIVAIYYSNPLHPAPNSAEDISEYGFLVSEPIFLPVPSLLRMVDMPCDEPSTLESGNYAFGYNNGTQRTVLISAFIVYDPFTSWSNFGLKPDIVL